MQNPSQDKMYAPNAVNSSRLLTSFQEFLSFHLLLSEPRIRAQNLSMESRLLARNFLNQDSGSFIASGAGQFFGYKQWRLRDYFHLNSKNNLYLPLVSGLSTLGSNIIKHIFELNLRYSVSQLSLVDNGLLQILSKLHQNKLYFYIALIT